MEEYTIRSIGNTIALNLVIVSLNAALQNGDSPNKVKSTLSDYLSRPNEIILALAEHMDDGRLYNLVFDSEEILHLVAEGFTSRLSYWINLMDGTGTNVHEGLSRLLQNTDFIPKNNLD